MLSFAAALGVPLGSLAQFPPWRGELELADQVDIGQADPRVVSSFRRVEQLLAESQWDDAVDALLELSESSGDAMWRLEGVQQPPGFETYLPLRQYLMLRLSQLQRQAPLALETYRSRQAALMERWFEEARRTDAPELWRRLIRQGWISSRGDDALWHWGAVQLREGRFSAARRAWEQLHPALRTPPALVAWGNAWAGRPLWLSLIGVAERPEIWTALGDFPQPADPPADWLAYPDTNLDLAQIRARLALTSILEGSLERAAVEVDIVRHLHPEASGVVGGRTGTWVMLLDELLQEAKSWRPQPPPLLDWPMFGGRPERMAAVQWSAFDPSFSPAWSADLPQIPVAEDGRSLQVLRPAEGQQEGLSYHPIVIGSQVVLAQPDAIRVLELETGKPAFASAAEQPGALRGEVYRSPGPPPMILAEPQLGVPRFTLSSLGRQVFARLGDPHTAWQSENPDLPPTTILGLDLDAQGRMLQGFPLAAPAGWRWEGSPVAAEHRLFTAARRQEPLSSELAVVCHNAYSGEMLWQTTVVSAPPLGKGRWNEVTHHLLTCHDGMVYYNTHQGAVAALDAEDGRLQWVCRYPRTPLSNQQPDQYTGFLLRDLTPCMYWRDLIFVAPGDSDRLFAVDAGTGRIQWCSAPGQGADIVHVLGVVGNQLLASGDHLYWWNAETGAAEGQFPPPQREAPGHGLAEPRGHGRGLVAGNLVYWPTKNQLFVFQANSERTAAGWRPVLSRPPIDLAARGAEGGNLIPAGAWLLIAAETKLYAFR